MKTKPGQAALFDHVKKWIRKNIDTPAGLRLSGNLVRAYFRPGELGNPEQLTTQEAFGSWAEQQNMESIYIESSDTYHLKQKAKISSPPGEVETRPPAQRPARPA